MNKTQTIGFLLIFMLGIESYAQDTKLKSLQGEWKVQAFYLKPINGGIEAPAKNSENTMWHQLMTEKVLIGINAAGDALCNIKDQSYNINFLIEGSKLKLTYRGGRPKLNGNPVESPVSYTVYDYSLTKNTLILNRQDPEFKEQIKFIKVK